MVLGNKKVSKRTIGSFKMLFYRNFFKSNSIDPDHVGYDIFDDMPDDTERSQKLEKSMQENTPSTTTPEKIIKPAKRKSPLRRRSRQKDVVDAPEKAIDTNADDSDTELFEIEESDAPLIPLYHLRDEGTTKWVLLSDLCYLLKIKSKDTLMKMVRFPIIKKIN